jgi:hypothetical protein
MCRANLPALVPDAAARSIPSTQENHAVVPLVKVLVSPLAITTSKYLALGNQLPPNQPAACRASLGLRNRWRAVLED